MGNLISCIIRAGSSRRKRSNFFGNLQHFINSGRICIITQRDYLSCSTRYSCFQSLNMFIQIHTRLMLYIWSYTVYTYTTFMPLYVLTYTGTYTHIYTHLHKYIIQWGILFNAAMAVETKPLLKQALLLLTLPWLAEGPCVQTQL